MTDRILTLTEQMEIINDVNEFDTKFTDDVIDAAETYDIDENPLTLEYEVTLYDASGVALASAKVEDYDTAVVYLEEIFELDELDDYEGVDDEAAASGSRYGHDSSTN